MTTSVFGHRRPDDRPPREEDWSTGVTISIVAHATLIGALVWGLHWRSSTEPTPASAELWAAIPETAAPPPVEAPPPPPAPAPAPEPAPVEAPKPPDIVVEQVKEKKPPKPTPAPPPPRPAPPPPAPKPAPPQEKLDAKTLQKMREENLKRMMGQMNAPANATGTGARNAGPSANYLGRIVARLKPNAVVTDPIPGNPIVEVEIRCAPDGTILSRRITKPSGNKAWDDTVVRAIDKTAKLPVDTDGKALDTIPIAWGPQD